MALLLALLFPALSAALSPISVKGTKLYNEDGEQFFIKGVTYSRANTELLDVLEDTTQCQIDAGFMKDLGVNTVRVYYIDSSADHDGCMQAFDSQGIYLWIDLPSTTTAINRIEPAWTAARYDAYAAVVDSFAAYNNTLAFSIGNEVIQNAESISAAPYVKAATRDIKAFRDARGYREIPVSYVSADVVSMQAIIADYFACGDETDAIDIFGLNTYAWCGNSSYQEAGYDTLYQQLSHLNIPSVFTETGCDTESPRTWDEISVMLGSVLPSVFSGAIVYEWGEHINQYGLVEYDNEQNTGFPTALPDYDNLKAVFSTVRPASTAETAYRPSNTAPACPASSGNWTLDPTATLPTIAGLKLETVTARTTLTTVSNVPQTSSSDSHASATSSGVTTDTTPEGTTASDGISTGAIAGIAVGGAAVAITVGMLAFFLLRERRARRASPTDEKNDSGGLGYSGKAELSGASSGKRFSKQELAATEKKGFYAATQETDAAGRHRQLYSYEKDAHNHMHAYEMEGSMPQNEMEGSVGTQFTSTRGTSKDR